jgi:hypothetical protein
MLEFGVASTDPGTVTERTLDIRELEGPHRQGENEVRMQFFRGPEPDFALEYNLAS